MSTFMKWMERGWLVGDGGMGTLLQSAGLTTGSCGELWNIDCAETVVELHRRYVEAGSDFIITNSFGANPHKLKAYGLDGRTEAINVAAASVAREAAGDCEVCILGDIGPSGAILEPYGDMPKEQLKAQYMRQVAGLLEGGVDAFIVETMMDFAEVACAVEAIRVKTDLPIIISLFFNPDRHQPGQFRTMYGDTPATIVEKSAQLDVEVLGSNCGMSIEHYVELTKRFRESTDKPLYMQPNAGMGHPGKDGVAVYDDPPERMASLSSDLYAAGATVVGGCCGTGPEFIHYVRRVADAGLAESK